MGVQPYDQFAAAYAAAGFGHFSENIVRSVIKRWRRCLPSGSHVADLACGVGSAATEFAAAGYHVVGVDLSFEMLRRATGLRVQGDLRAIPLRPGGFSAAICLYDAINHIPPGDLTACLAEVGRILSCEGRFLVDANTLAGATMWTQETYRIAKDGVRLEVASEYDPATKRVTNQVRGHVLERDGMRRIEETIVEWFHPAEVIEQAASVARFKRVRRDKLYMDGQHPATPSKWLYEFVKVTDQPTLS